MAPRNLIYYPSSDASDIDAIAANPYYTNVVLGQWHMDQTTGALSWNDTAIGDVPSDVWTAVRGLSQGQSPKIVSMQLGSAGNGTWSYIANNMSDASSILMGVINGGYGIQGIDLDPEPVGAVSLDTLLNFTVLLGQQKQNTSFYLSHAPVPWDSDYFPQLYQGSNWSQIASYVDWIMVQWYGNTGQLLVGSYESFISSSAVTAPLVVGGQEFSSTSPPLDLTALTAAIEKLGSKYSGAWGGIGIWAYPLPTSPDWAQEISEALQTT